VPNTGLRIVVAVSVVGMIAANILANALPFFGRGTGEVSSLYPTLVTPAGYVFAIWGLIYVGLLAYTVAQFTAPVASDTLPDRLAWPLIVSCVANVTWLLLWHSLNIYLTVIAMLVLLCSLIVAYRIAHDRDRVSRSTLELWAVRVPLGLYLGWVSVATIANVSNALVAAQWRGWGLPPQWWGVIVLVVGAALAITALVREADGVFAAVFVWAFFGIAAATGSDLVRVAATSLAGAIALAIIVTFATRRRLA
jgi:translocator protein